MIPEEPVGVGLAAARSAFAALGLDVSPDGADLPPSARTATAVTALRDLLTATLDVAEGRRRKALVPLADEPIEVALVRRAGDVLVSCYRTGAVPEILALDRPVRLEPALRSCAEAAERAATEMRARLDATTAFPRGARGVDPAGVPFADELARLADRARTTTIGVGPDEPALVELRVGAQELDPSVEPTSTDDPPRAAAKARGAWRLGASMLVPRIDAGGERAASVDLHALLLHGRIWAIARGRPFAIAGGHVLLHAERMVSAGRSLVEAFQVGRATHLRVRSGDLAVALRLGREGDVVVALGENGREPVAVPDLTVGEVAGSFAELALALVRAVLRHDRSQRKNLRLLALRDDAGALRRAVREVTAAPAVTHADPARLRVPEVAAVNEPPSLDAGPLRYVERWRSAVDGLDVHETFLCGDRLVGSAYGRLVALDRDSGSLLWSRSVERAATMMAGATLVRLTSRGELSLCDVADGEAYATTRVKPRVGRAVGLAVGGPGVPPAVVVAEGASGLVAVDLRTGEARWRFAARGRGGFRLRRAGRVLVVASGDTALVGIDAATGELAWRRPERTRFTSAPVVHRETCIAAGGLPDGDDGVMVAVDLYAGTLLWRRVLDGAPLSPPIACGDVVVITAAKQGVSRMVALDAATGEPRWSVPDPGVGRGAAWLAVDDCIVLNTRGGTVMALDAATGTRRWMQRLAHPLADELPHRLEPVLRGGALFVPSVAVHVVRPSDGATLGRIEPGDIVPDLLRVDERGWAFVAEDAGQIRGYAVGPRLRLV
ncbi:MAG: PQQ-like beta-propeller repeat protein [Deltaproteobacteria bacterium]|nr:PQQ-like beta-propeller repeat protein [Deltaproteobacteria bacterium]